MASCLVSCYPLAFEEVTWEIQSWDTVPWLCSVSAPYLENILNGSSSSTTVKALCNRISCCLYNNFWSLTVHILPGLISDCSLAKLHVVNTQQYKTMKHCLTNYCKKLHNIIRGNKRSKTVKLLTTSACSQEELQHNHRQYENNSPLAGQTVHISALSGEANDWLGYKV